MTDLEAKLGREFINRDYLKTALTHSSYANENRGAGECNERLEFLGDAVLGVITAEHLYNRYKEMPEGKMTRLRAEMVCEESLAAVADKLDLGEYLRLGRGEEAGGGRKRPSILADAVEAVIAALYLDGGIDEAKSFVYDRIISVYESGEKTVDTDYKTMLQELVQKNAGHTLSYKLTGESGPDHAKVFAVQVCLDGRVIAEGEGKSKKKAEQAAACAALEILK